MEQPPPVLTVAFWTDMHQSKWGGDMGEAAHELWMHHATLGYHRTLLKMLEHKCLASKFNSRRQESSLVALPWVGGWHSKQLPEASCAWCPGSRPRCAACARSCRGCRGVGGKWGGAGGCPQTGCRWRWTAFRTCRHAGLLRTACSMAERSSGIWQAITLIFDMITGIQLYFD